MLLQDVTQNVMQQLPTLQQEDHQRHQCLWEYSQQFLCRSPYSCVLLCQFSLCLPLVNDSFEGIIQQGCWPTHNLRPHKQNTNKHHLQGTAGSHTAVRRHRDRPPDQQVTLTKPKSSQEISPYSCSHMVIHACRSDSRNPMMPCASSDAMSKEVHPGAAVHRGQ